jgi:hypothetical protein
LAMLISIEFGFRAIAAAAPAAVRARSSGIAPACSNVPNRTRAGF